MSDGPGLHDEDYKAYDGASPLFKCTSGCSLSFCKKQLRFKFEKNKTTALYDDDTSGTRWLKSFAKQVGSLTLVGTIDRIVPSHQFQCLAPNLTRQGLRC